MAPPKKRSLPKPLPEGFILIDTEKKSWRLGRLIGQGGCGLVYTASLDLERPVPSDAQFVVKVENLENGPLFCELKFYQRAAKKDTIQRWMQRKRLDFLGIPSYWGSGQAQHNDLRYRFMVLDRLGCDLQTLCDRHGGMFTAHTVLQLGKRLVDVLEFIHDSEYVHGDIKAANVMQGLKDQHQVYLADYGLCYRYCPEGAHKEYKENPKKGHDGTIEYTSLDAHKGVAPSRRSDLQILGFCLLHWLSGGLPWTGLRPEQVQEAKTRFLQDLPESVKQLTSDQSGTDELCSFLRHVRSLQYQDKPDYDLLRQILHRPGSGLDLDLRPRPESRPQEPARRQKKTVRGRGAPGAEAVEEEEKRTKPKQIDPKYLRGPPISSSQSGAEAMELDEEEEEEEDEEEEEEEDEETRTKQINPKYLRGPPLCRAQVQTEAHLLRVRTPRHTHFHTDDEDEEEEEQLRRGPKPRGPHTEAKVRSPCDREDSYSTDHTGALRWWIFAGLCLLVAAVTLNV